MCDDLQTTLAINKNIIKNLLTEPTKKTHSANSTADYTINQLTQENEMLEANLKRVTEERDQLQTRLFIM